MAPPPPPATERSRRPSTRSPAGERPTTAPSPGRTVEQRRFHRVPVDAPLRFTPKDEDRFADASAVDISLGGMFVATTSPAPFGAEIMIHLRLGDAEKEFVLPAIVRWTNAAGMGVQFGSLGARPTLAITEIVRSYQERESAKAPKRAR